MGLLFYLEIHSAGPAGLTFLGIFFVAGGGWSTDVCVVIFVGVPP